MSNGKSIHDSHVFEWVVLVLLIIFAVGFVVLWAFLQKSGKLSNCLGKKGSWTGTGKNLVENLIIQRFNREKIAPMLKDCLKCIIKTAEQQFEPTDFITDLDKMTADVKKIVDKCGCKIK